MKSNSSLLKILSGLLLLAAGNADGQVVTVPPDLAPGQQYRLAFLSSTGNTADSSDIDVYNTIVDNLAEAVPELAALNQDWKVIGSTADVDARTNTSTDPSPAGATGVPIYLLNGTKLAENYDELWGGSVDVNLDIVEFGATGQSTLSGQPLVWTGTNASGFAFEFQELGSPGARVGQRNANGSTWINLTDIPPWQFCGNLTPVRLYGISGVLTVPRTSIAESVQALVRSHCCKEFFLPGLFSGPRSLHVSIITMLRKLLPANSASEHE